MKIRGDLDVSDIKRCYVDMTHSERCPKCNGLMEYDFNDQYLSYPVVGQYDSIVFYCDDCDEEIEVNFKITKAELEIEIEKGET